MYEEFYFVPVEMPELEPDSPENCAMLFEVLGAVALSVGEEYPSKKIIPVYEVPHESL